LQSLGFTIEEFALEIGKKPGAFFCSLLYSPATQVHGQAIEACLGNGYLLVSSYATSWPGISKGTDTLN